MYFYQKAYPNFIWAAFVFLCLFCLILMLPFVFSRLSLFGTLFKSLCEALCICFEKCSISVLLLLLCRHFLLKVCMQECKNKNILTSAVTHRTQTATICSAKYSSSLRPSSMQPSHPTASLIMPRPAHYTHFMISAILWCKTQKRKEQKGDQR